MGLIQRFSITKSRFTIVEKKSKTKHQTQQKHE